MDRLNVLLVGEPGNLSRAFPEMLRHRIAGHANILPCEFSGTGWRDRSDARDALRDTDIIMATWGVPRLDVEFLTAAPRLKALLYAAGSLKQFATDEAYDRGIVFSSAWEANAIPVAEFTHALVTLSLKRFWFFLDQPPALRFDRQDVMIPGNFTGSTVGLLSLGAIGRGVAARLRASNELRIIAHDPYVDPRKASDLGVTLVSLKDLFSLSDIVSIHTPWLPETENMVNGKLIASMKPGASLVNTSRGAIINESDLINVLRNRPDLTALLDVTHPEPPTQDSPLRTLKNVILTPHIAGSLGGEITRMGLWMLDELNRYLDGQPLRHAVSRDMLPLMA